MAVTPNQLFDLALQRHREPWNWTFHFAALWLFALTFLMHSYLMLATSLIALGSGFFRLRLGPPPDNRWFRFVAMGVEWEKNWIGAPWNIHKWGWFLFAVLASGVFVWALWTRDIAFLLLYLVSAYFWRIVRENRADGIDP